MTRSFLYSAGLVFTIMGATGILSDSGPEWARYLVLGMGILLLLLSYIRRPRS